MSTLAIHGGMSVTDEPFPMWPSIADESIARAVKPYESAGVRIADAVIGCILGGVTRFVEPYLVCECERIRFEAFRLGRGIRRATTTAAPRCMTRSAPPRRSDGSWDPQSFPVRCGWSRPFGSPWPPAAFV